jgi:tetratricopeptide (TPR) repeat protein
MKFFKKPFMKRLIIIFLIIVSQNTFVFASSYYGMGRTAYVYRNFDKAREYFLKDIKETDRGDSYYFLGEIEKTLKNYDQSLYYFQIAVTKNTTRKYLVNAYWNLIILYEEKGDYNNFVKYCRDLWYRTGDSSGRRKIEGLINRLLWTDNEQAIQKYKEGMALVKKGDKAGAVKLFRESLSTDSSFLAPRFELGMDAYNSGNENEAFSHLSVIGERIPFYAEVHLVLGGINFKNRNYSSAIENYNSVINYSFIDKNTEYNVRLKRGTCYYYLNNLDEAEKNITSVLDNIKKDTEPLSMLSAINIKNKNFQSALKILSRAESISGNDPVVLFQTGSIYYHENNLKYVTYFDRLYNAIKNSSTELKNYFKAVKILITYHFEKNNYNRVIEISDTLNKIQNDPDITLISAKSYYFLKQYEKAIEFFSKIHLNYSSRVMFASAYAYIEKKEKAVEQIKIFIDNQAAKQDAMNDPKLKKYIEEIETARAEEIKKKQNTQKTGDMKKQ